MNLKIREDSQNYTATVIQLPVKQKVEGLDNLVKVTVFGNDVLIGKDEPDGLYLFFPSGTQLSHYFCLNNNLYRESQLNADQNSKGFFEPNRRVKAIKFKGVISTGFVIPMTCLAYIGKGIWEEFQEGDEFNEIEGIEVCRKYIVKVRTPGMNSVSNIKKHVKLANLLIPNQFRFHEETSHLAKNLHMLNPEDIIVITDKWHGSSCILAKVYVHRPLDLWRRFLNFLGAETPKIEYAYIYASGKPKSNLPKGIEGRWSNTNKDYYVSNIWKRALDDNRKALEDGITLYGELVGFTEGGSAIQGGYDYGCEYIMTRDQLERPNPFYRFMVYRITYTKPDGNVIEFSWQQIKDYCIKYNLEYVKEFYFGKLAHFSNVFTYDNPIDLFLEVLSCTFNMEEDCKHCTNKVPAEGIVVRIDGKERFLAYKLKSKRFLKLEDEQLDKEIINMEDSQ